MKVILLKSVPKVGKKDEVVEVNQGYAQNALFPKRLAIPATPQALDALNKRQQNVEAEKLIRRNLLDRAIETVNGGEMKMIVQSNEQGSLFSKIDEEDIATFLESQRTSIDPHCIKLPNGPIKKTGVHDVNIEDGEYRASIKINISSK